MTAIDPTVFSKSLDTVNTVGKIVENITTPRKQGNNPPPPPKPVDSKPNATNQTVEVKVGDDRRDKPMIIHDKQETHVHKTYPDDRQMSKEECEVEKLRIQVAHENAKEDREFRLQLDERNRKERRERDDEERRRRDEARLDKKKSDRRFWICMAVFGTACLGAMGYLIYDDYRTSRALGLPASEPKASLKISVNGKDIVNKPKTQKVIPVEGTVK